MAGNEHSAQREGQAATAVERHLGLIFLLLWGFAGWLALPDEFGWMVRGIAGWYRWLLSQF